MSKKRLAVWTVASIGALLIGLCSYPPTRQWLQERVSTPYTRRVLATVEGDILNDGSTVKALKFQGPESIFIEVINPTTNELLARIVLPDKHDGMFNLHGKVTSLAVADIDGHGNVLLIPTFDDQLVPHLNIYRYNPAEKRFEAIKKP